MIMPGSDPQKDMMDVKDFFERYKRFTGRNVSDFTPPNLTKVINNMNAGSRVVLNQNQHVVMAKDVIQQSVKTVYSPNSINRIIVNVMDPARGGNFTKWSVSKFLKSDFYLYIK